MSVSTIKQATEPPAQAGDRPASPRPERAPRPARSEDNRGTRPAQKGARPEAAPRREGSKPAAPHLPSAVGLFATAPSAFLPIPPSHPPAARTAPPSAVQRQGSPATFSGVAVVRCACATEGSIGRR